jgi:GNAT superfamily N-acetyltransferase
MTTTVTIGQARASDVAGLAQLLWEMHDAPPAGSSIESFADELGQWWTARADSHLAFVARIVHHQIVGMAWLALVPRVPRPGSTSRCAGDIQSVYVRPEHRGKRIGSDLVQAAVEHAERLGALHVTVHSGRRAVPVYERLGFTSSPQLLQRER